MPQAILTEKTLKLRHVTIKHWHFEKGFYAKTPAIISTKKKNLNESNFISKLRMMDGYMVYIFSFNVL